MLGEDPSVTPFVYVLCREFMNEKNPSLCVDGVVHFMVLLPRVFACV